MARTGRANSRPHAIRRRRTGVTLIELLVVLTILLAITSVAVRTMSTDTKSRRQREAARAVNICLSSARYRALETGRPCGVKFDRMVGRLECSVVVQQVETPPVYAGDAWDATCTVKAGGAAGGRISVTATINAAPPMVNPGDLVQFNGQGPWYRVDAAGASLTASLDASQGQLVPWTAQNSSAVPYRVQRTPMKSAATPLQLPGGALVDLACSGIETVDPTVGSFQSGGNAAPLIITFGANGAVDRVWVRGNVLNVTQPIFLLIGKPERLSADVSADGKLNWQDTDNLWIAINPQNGLTTTAKLDDTTSITASRYNARTAQSAGGR